MRKLIYLILISIIPILFLIACDGGGGDGGGEFTVFDASLDIQEEELVNPDPSCLKNIFLRLSIMIDESQISGYAQLFGRGRLGKREEISGIVQNGFFSLEQFEVQVSGEGGSDRLSLSEFEGVLNFNAIDESVTSINGDFSGSLFFVQGDAVFCDGNVSGEFSAEEKIPVGCVSKAELTFNENRNCPAEAISNLCDNVSYLCEIPESEPPGDFLIDNSCVAIGCFTIDCSFLQISNLQLNINGGISGDFVTSGEPISCAL